MVQDSFWRQSPTIVGPAKAAEFHTIGQKETRDALEAWILSESNHTTNLLDAGCNTGVLGFRLFSKGYKGGYVGADSNHKALAQALENLSDRAASFTLNDLDTLPYADKFFDVTVTKDVIEHVRTFEPIMQSLFRVTKEFIIVSFFIKLHDGEPVIHQTKDGYYLNRYNRQAFYDFAKTCGFMLKGTLYADNNDNEVLLFKRA